MHFTPSTLAYQPDAYVLQSQLILAIRQASHVDRRITAVATFISTERVLAVLCSAGFLPVEARQSTRSRSPVHARHLIRLRRRFETIELRDAIPELSEARDNSGNQQRNVMRRTVLFARKNTDVKHEC